MKCVRTRNEDKTSESYQEVTRQSYVRRLLARSVWTCSRSALCDWHGIEMGGFP